MEKLPASKELYDFPELISKSDHYEWFNSIKASQNNFWYMYENSGIIYFNLIEEDVAEWGFYKSHLKNQLA